MGFFSAFAGVKADQAVNGAKLAIMNLDFKGGSAAELRDMEGKLDAFGLKVSEAAQTLARETQEYEAIHRISDQKMAAAELLQRQINAETDPARRASLEASLAKLVGELEQLAPDVERERQDMVTAKAFLDELQGVYDQKGAELRSAKAELERGQQDMQRAAQQRETAERRAQMAREVSGLAGATNHISTALDVMRAAAAKDRRVAEAAAAKARVLAPVRTEDDPHIAAAMAAVSGKPANTSLADRLAALKQPKAA